MSQRIHIFCREAGIAPESRKGVVISWSNCFPGASLLTGKRTDCQVLGWDVLEGDFQDTHLWPIFALKTTPKI